MEEEKVIRFHLTNGNCIDTTDNGLFEKMMTTDDSINAIAIENLNANGRYTIINWNNVLFAEILEECDK